MSKYWSEKKTKVLVIMISTFLWGLVAHGYMLANKISYHDDIYNLYYVGGTYGMGRWMLGIIGKICSLLGGNYSLSWWNGLCSFFFIGMTVYLICELFKMEQKKSWILASGIMVVFPVITGLFGYMFTSFPYMIGLCMGTLGVTLVSNQLAEAKIKKKILEKLVGIGFICCAIGVYQPYFGFLLCLLVLDLIQEGLFGEKTWKQVWQQVWIDLGCAVASLILYLIANKIFLALVHKEMYHYDGVENMGLVSVSTYLSRVLVAYSQFFFPKKNTVYDMYPMAMHGIYRLLLIVAVILIVKNLIKLWIKDIKMAVSCGFFFLLLPMMINFIFILADVSSIYTLTMYGQVLQFIIVLFLLEREEGHQINWIKGVKAMGYLLLLFSIVWYTRYDNICYFKAELLQKRAIAYYENLITRIEQVEGYDASYPVAFIHPLEKEIPNMKVDEELARITIMPYQDNTIINNYVWDMFMAEWCGYEPVIYDGNYVEAIMDISDMPHYPQEGSIAVRDEIVIVNF